MSVITAAFQTFQKATSHTSHAGTRTQEEVMVVARRPRGVALEVRKRKSRNILYAQAPSGRSHQRLNARSHGTQAEDRCAVSGDESVVWPWPLARGLTSGWEIPHGDSFTSRCLVVDAVDPAGARAKPCTLRVWRSS